MVLAFLVFVAVVTVVVRIYDILEAIAKAVEYDELAQTRQGEERR